MSKLSAILLISLFAFSQYARQLSYLECKFSNTFKTGPAKCDCEKQSGFSNQASGPSPVSATHTHIHTDEFFPFVKGIIIAPCPDVSRLIPYCLQDGDERDGNYPAPWEPPNT
ncbi:MAG: hypothetical protein H7Y01_06200 [Ferruginibacter sp.]|nr:hypothetical protein [Chitinophagaceae bacterium]